MTRNRIDPILSRLHLNHRDQVDRHHDQPIQHRLIPVTLTRRENSPKPMSAERSIVEQPRPETRDVWKVAQWKWGIDDGSPRWKQLFFKYVFLPFQSFSFRLGIPTPKEVVVEYDNDQRVIRRTFRWWEDEGIFDDPDQADAGCLDEHWGYTNLPHGRLMPSGSGTYGVTVFPRKQHPKSYQWAKPKSTFVIKERKKEELQQQTLAEYIKQLHQVLDR